MPQDHINFKGRRRGTCHNTCKANGQILSTDLVNGPTAPNGCKPSASTTSESTPAVTLNGTQPQCMVNGYINYGCKGKSTKTPKKEGRRISAVTDASAAGKDGGGGIPGGISVSGVTSLDGDAHNFDQMTPDHSLSASMKNKWRKKFRRKKRDTKTDSLENCKFLFFKPQEEENWENEIKDVTLPDKETMCFGVKPYGPEDVLHFALRDMTLKQGDTVGVPVTTSYTPAVHHQQPVRWLCCSITPEPDQFADAEESSPASHQRHHSLSHQQRQQCGCFSSPVSSHQHLTPVVQWGHQAVDAAGARLRAAFSMVSPTMKAVVDAVWAVWSIGASIYDYIHTTAMEERIHALENVITIHQCVIGLLSAGVLALFTYILFKKL